MWSLAAGVRMEDLSHRLTRTDSGTNFSRHVRTLAQLPSVRKEEELARGIKYSNKISREHSRGGMSVCI